MVGVIEHLQLGGADEPGHFSGHPSGLEEVAGRVHAENIAKFVPEMEIKTIADPYMSEETVEFLRRL